MQPTALSIETKLKDGLKLRGLSSQEFAEVAKLEGIANSSRAVLDKAFRGAQGLRNETALRLLALFDEIETMILDFLPFPLDVSNGKRLHASLAAPGCRRPCPPSKRSTVPSARNRKPRACRPENTAQRSVPS